MNYSNGKKKVSNPCLKPNKSRLGMSLESDINKSNESYLDSKIANIHKKPTPITIVKVSYPKRSAAKITEAYFKLPSTTDYNGIFDGKYIDFEAKECHSKTSFPFTSIYKHQIDHLASVVSMGGIAFIILRMAHYDETYLIKAIDFINYYKKSKRKSLPYSWILENGYIIPRNYIRPCDYLKIVKEVF